MTFESGLAEAALGEGQGARLHKLSVKDIKYVSFPFSQGFGYKTVLFTSSLEWVQKIKMKDEILLGHNCWLQCRPSNDCTSDMRCESLFSEHSTCDDLRQSGVAPDVLFQCGNTVI